MSQLSEFFSQYGWVAWSVLILILLFIVFIFWVSNLFICPPNEVLIFSGKKVQWATLRFTPERARYVSLEEWHPKQRARYEKDGSYVLEVPFSSEKELVMDILKIGAEVEVVAPQSLRKSVRDQAAAAAKKNS